jgi:hypothetical protein
MRRKRPCSICRRWFLPDARAKGRQQVCGAEQCQRERHRRACGLWRRRNPEYDRDRRLRERLTSRVAPDDPGQQVDPLGGVDWRVARDAVGLEVAVIIEESGKVIVDWARDAVLAQRREIRRKLAGHPGPGLRDAIGGEPTEPVASAS